MTGGKRKKGQRRLIILPLSRTLTLQRYPVNNWHPTQTVYNGIGGQIKERHVDFH